MGNAPSDDDAPGSRSTSPRCAATEPRFAARAGVPLLPMVKADAYGLGAVRVARARGARPVGVRRRDDHRRRGAAPRRHHATDRRFHAICPRRFDATACAGSPPRSPTRRRSSVGADAAAAGISRSTRGWPRRRAVEPGRRSTASCFRATGRKGCSHTFIPRISRRQLAGEQEQRFDEALALLPFRPTLVHAENSPAVEQRGSSRWTSAGRASSSTASAATTHRRSRRRRSSRYARASSRRVSSTPERA